VGAAKPVVDLGSEDDKDVKPTVKKEGGGGGSSSEGGRYGEGGDISSPIEVGKTGDFVFTQNSPISTNILSKKYSTMMESF
jgi:hypothetical protein